MDSLSDRFQRFVCQTSPSPLGLEIAHAEGCWIHTTDGKRYLDFLSGIGVANIGHAHPAVVAAVREQIEKYLHVMVYGEVIQEPQVQLAELLSCSLPDPLEVVYFTNSGTEANEGALKTAKKFTGRHRLVSFENSYHGDSQGSLSVTGRAVYRDPFLPLLPDVTFLPFNDVDSLERIDGSVAAVMVEPIQGEGGIRVPSDSFLPALRHRCTQTGALLIFDEVQTGFGRTGELFACEHWGVVPDIITHAKALGGGMPLGAFVGPREIMHTLSVDPPLSHVTTFGGHPVCCAAGLASLHVILGNNLAGQAAFRGEQLRNALREIATHNSHIREVRGLGLMIGLELDQPEAARRLVTNALERGLILGGTLHTGSVIRITPPLILTEEEMQSGLEIIEESLAA